MPHNDNRRRFLKRTMGVTGGLAAGAVFEHRPLLARMAGSNPPAPASSAGAVPMGKLGHLNVSRLICGGNLFSGFAHSGNLVYVTALLKQYFTEDKIMDTLQLSEECGINTAILRTDDHIVKVLKRYRRERGGRIQWIAQTYPKIDNLTDNIKQAVDNGAVGAFIMGGNAETFFRAGRVEQMGEAIAFMKRNKLVAGVGAHILAIPRSVEAMKIEPDFYFKTLNSVGYESEAPPDVTNYMKAMKKPWVAFKVLGAGRMKPREGFDLAFRSGADFVNVGMYDFQIKEDAALVKDVVSVHSARERAWA